MTASIMNPSWRYVRSEATDISKTIAKEKKRLADLKKVQEAAEVEASTKVRRIKKGE